MSDARRTAAEILHRVDVEGAFAAALLEAEVAKFRDDRDAGLATELVLGVLRRRAWLDHLIGSAASRGIAKIEPPVLVVLRVAVYQMAFLGRVPARAAVDEAVNQIKKIRGPRGAGFANGLLRALGRRDPLELLPGKVDASNYSVSEAAVRLGLPEWLMEDIAQSLGAGHAVRLLERYNAPSPRSMRINVGRVSIDEVLDRLGDVGERGRFTPWSVTVHDREKARALQEDGLGVFQDEGSALVCMAVDPKPGEKILDACAGRGGKTGTLAVAAGGPIELVATDRKVNKLERLAFDLTRQGLAARCFAADLTVEGSHKGEQFDRVLVDAPCSGTGTMGRRPEIRWKLRQKDVTALAAVQARMLDVAMKLVKPGGRLVFASCSVLKEEGTDHLDQITRDGQFELVASPPLLWPQEISWNDGAPLIDPGFTGTDGYSILCLEKR